MKSLIHFTSSKLTIKPVSSEPIIWHNPSLYHENLLCISFVLILNIIRRIYNAVTYDISTTLFPISKTAFTMLHHLLPIWTLVKSFETELSTMENVCGVCVTYFKNISYNMMLWFLMQALPHPKWELNRIAHWNFFANTSALNHLWRVA